MKYNGFYLFSNYGVKLKDLVKHVGRFGWSVMKTLQQLHRFSREVVLIR